MYDISILTILIALHKIQMSKVHILCSAKY